MPLSCPISGQKKALMQEFPSPVFLQKMDHYKELSPGLGNTTGHTDSCTISKSRAVQAAQSSPGFSLCPLMSCYSQGSFTYSEMGSQQCLKRSRSSVRKAPEGLPVTPKELMVLAGLNSQGVNRRGSAQSCNVPSSPAIWLSTSSLMGGTSLWAQLLMCNTE